MDIASLGIQINTSDVQKAETDLDKLARAGANAEQSAGKVGTAWQQAGDKMGKASTPAAQVAASFRQGSEAIKAQQAELSALIGRIDPVVGALGRLDQMEEQLRKHSAAGLLGKEDFGVYAGKIDAMRRSLSAANDDLGKTGLTAKQTAAALRGVPAQFTDIATSLQGGQNPLTVFLQQGGQLKDMFGGAGPAAQALGGYVAGLVNPFTAAAAAVAVLALAYKQGSDESTAFNKSLILTGNYAGSSAGQFAAMASAIDGVVGTQSQAASALAEIAGSGKFAAGQIQAIATAAVAMEDATGQAVSSTVAEFARLADEPAAASAKLNEQYHYLTASIYEQIAALEDQGDAAGAAALAISTFGDAMQKRSEEINGSLGVIEGSWKRIKNAASEAWDEMLGVGRPETPEEKLGKIGKIDAGGLAANALVLGPLGLANEAYKQIKDKFFSSDTDRQTEIQGLYQEIQNRDTKAWNEGLKAQQEQAAIESQKRIDQLEIATRSNAEKRKKALEVLDRDLANIRAVNPDDKRLTAESISAQKQAIEAKYKDPKTPKVKAYTDDAATKMLESLRQQKASLDDQLVSADKLTEAEKAQVKFTQLIADLKTKSILTADQKSLLANQDSISAQLAKNAALSVEVRRHEDIIKLQERSAQLQSSITEAQASRRDQQAGELDAFGKGKEELQRVKEQASIRKEYARYQRQLDAATPKDALGSAEYREASAKIKAQLDVSLKDQEKYYDELDKKRTDSNNGATAAFADYVANAKDASSQTYDMFSGAFQGMEDALVKFAMTGKLSFSDLADSIMADLIRIEIKKAVVWAVGSGSPSADFVGPMPESGGASALSTAWTAAKAVFGFDGGGYTGDLPRVGGIDGKGGFMAVLHPQETVTDHTKPSRNGRATTGGGITIGQMNFPGITNASEARVATATAAKQLGRLINGAGRYA